MAALDGARRLVEEQRKKNFSFKNFSFKAFIVDLPLLRESMSGEALTACFVHVAGARQRDGYVARTHAPSFTTHCPVSL